MRVDNHKLKLDPSITQTSPNGKDYKVIGLEKDGTQPPKWIGRTEKYFWRVYIRFEETRKLAIFTFDYNDNCIKKETI